MTIKLDTIEIVIMLIAIIAIAVVVESIYQIYKNMEKLVATQIKQNELLEQIIDQNRTPQR